MEFRDKNLYDKCIERFTQLEGKHTNFTAARKIITEFLLPDEMWHTDEGSRGMFFGENIYEGTAPWAVDTFATAFCGATVSKGVPWLSHRFGAEELRGVDFLDGWVQRVTEQQVYTYSDRSNFYDSNVQIPFTKHAVSTASPVMLIEEDENLHSGIIHFLPQHWSHCFVSYDRFNRPNGLIIKDTTWTIKQVVDEFCKGRTPEERLKKRKEKLSQSMVNLYDNGHYYDEVTVYRFIFKYSDPMFDGKYKKPVNDDYKWISVSFTEDCPAENKDKPLNDNQGYFSKPFVNWDFYKMAYEAVSRSPAYLAIYDVMSQQTVHKNFLQNMQRKNNPQIVTLASMRNQIYEDIIIASDAQQYQNSPKPVDLVGEIQLNKELSDMLASAVKRWYKIPELLKFTELALTNKQPVSALQIMNMSSEKSILLSPAIESQGRYLADVDERVMDINRRAGRGPFSAQDMANVTDAVMENAKELYTGVDVVPKFMGSLAREQQMNQKLEPLKAGMDIATYIGERMQATKLAGLALRGYEALEEGWKASGASMKILKPEKDYQKSEDELAQAEAQQAATQTQIELMKASRGMNQPVDPSSPMAAMGVGGQNA